MQWGNEWTGAAEKALKRFNKRWPHEVTNIGVNLALVLENLSDGVHPEQLKKLPGVRSEPDGILAIDESGPGKGTKMKALRLYVFPDTRSRQLHVIQLGEKTNQQSRDIAACKKYVSELLSQSVSIEDANEAKSGESDNDEQEI